MQFYRPIDGLRGPKICGDAVFKDKVKKKYNSASFGDRKKCFSSKWGSISSEKD